MRILGNSGQPELQEMVAGDDLILTCEVSRANATIQWLFNEKPLLPDSRTNIESHGTLHKLTVSNIQPSDSGKYVCDAVDDKMLIVIKVQGMKHHSLQSRHKYMIYIIIYIYIKKEESLCSENIVADLINVSKLRVTLLLPSTPENKDAIKDALNVRTEYSFLVNQRTKRVQQENNIKK